MADLLRIKVEKQTHPDLTILSPFDIASEYSRLPTEEFRGDSHYALQICIVLHGASELVFEDYTRIYRSGELWWNMCWEPHAFRILSSRCIILSININVDNVGNVGPCSRADWLAPFTVPPSKRYCPETPAERRKMHLTARKLYFFNKYRPVNWKTHCWLLIHQLLLDASEAVEKESAAGGNTVFNLEMSRIQKAVQLVRTSPIPPSLGEAAAACSLSVSRFSVIFSSVMGVSYGQFALRVRLSNAANEVRSGLYTLNEIAERHGFCDASSFCNAFKKIYRCTPNEFKSRA